MLTQPLKPERRGLAGGGDGEQLQITTQLRQLLLRVGRGQDDGGVEGCCLLLCW